MIAAPPFDAGAVKVTVAEALPAVAVPITGAPGTVTALLLDDALLEDELLATELLLDATLLALPVAESPPPPQPASSSTSAAAAARRPQKTCENAFIDETPVLRDRRMAPQCLAILVGHYGQNVSARDALPASTPVSLPGRAEHLLQQLARLADRIPADRALLVGHHQEQAVERLAGHVAFDGRVLGIDQAELGGLPHQ